MTTSTVPNTNHTAQAPTAELSWDAIMAGQFTTSPARRLFEETVISRSASAKAALPGEAGRIDRSRDLVLANRVQPQEDGSFVVHSTSERGKSYTVTNSACTCPDAAKAPEGRCKHVLSTWIWRKSRSAIAGQDLPQEPATNGTTPEKATVTAQVAPGSTNGTGGDSQAIPPQLTLEEEAELSAQLAAQRPVPQPPLPEAAASMNCYITVAGYKVQLTVRGHDEQALLLRLGKFLSQFPPVETPPQASSTPATPAPAAKPVPEGWCRRHDCQMERWEKGGRVWFSHMLTDESWCRGK